MRTLLLVSAALIATLPMSAAVRIHGGFFVGRGFAPYGWYGPFYGPYPYGYYSYGPYVFGRPSTGEVKLDTDVKDAEVFIDGSFAGTVAKLKSMRLWAGTYDIEVRAPGRTQFEEKIYVVPGKTLHLHPDLRVEATS